MASERPKTKVLVAWSSGKDSAWTLHVLRQRHEVEVVGLLTTFNQAATHVNNQVNCVGHTTPSC